MTKSEDKPQCVSLSKQPYVKPRYTHLTSMLDGSCLNLPGFDLVPTSDPTDKAYCIEQGENYFTNEPVSFALHEMFHEIEQTFDKSQ